MLVLLKSKSNKSIHLNDFKNNNMITLDEFLKKILFLTLFFTFILLFKEGSSSESDGFLNNNLNDKTIIVAGSTLNDGAVLWINNKKIKLIGNALEAKDYFIMMKKYMLQAGNMAAVAVYGHLIKTVLIKLKLNLKVNSPRDKESLFIKVIHMLEVILTKVHVIG